MESPFIVGGKYTITAMTQFLWAVSVDFKEGDAEALDLFIENSIAVRDVDELYDGIDAYIDAVFLDAPGGTGVRGVPYVCSPAWLIYQMMCEPFRIPRLEAMDTPIRQFYQFKKCAQFANGEILYNSLSDPIKERWLANLRDAIEGGKN